MDYQQLNTFLILSRYENMSTAAEILHTSQPQVSKLIASLEAELGVPLFDRIGRRIRLNEQGVIFSRYASDSLQSIASGRAAVSSMNHSVRGTVVLGTFSFGPILGDAIQAFSENHPQIAFRHVIPSGIDRLDFMNMDLVLAPMVHGNYIFSNYFPVCRTLVHENYHFVCSPKFRRYPADQKTLSMKECSQYPFIIAAAGGSELTDAPTDASILQRLAAASDTNPPSILYSTQEFILKMSYLNQGLGFSILPDSCLPLAKQLISDLQIFDIYPFTPKRTVIIARRKKDMMSVAARQFWDHLIDFYHLSEDKAE